MLRRILQKSQFRRLPCRASTHQVPLPHFLAARFLSDSGSGGDEGESRVNDIYSDLFGPEHDGNEEWFGDGAGPSGSSTKDSYKEKAKDRVDEQDEEPMILPMRLWSDNLEISEEEFSTKWSFEDIPDWSPDFVSRISKERVQLHEGESISSCRSYLSLQKNSEL